MHSHHCCHTTMDQSSADGYQLCRSLEPCNVVSIFTFVHLLIALPFFFICSGVFSLSILIFFLCIHSSFAILYKYLTYFFFQLITLLFRSCNDDGIFNSTLLQIFKIEFCSPQNTVRRDMLYWFWHLHDHVSEQKLDCLTWRRKRRCLCK